MIRWLLVFFLLVTPAWAYTDTTYGGYACAATGTCNPSGTTVTSVQGTWQIPNVVAVTQTDLGTQGTAIWVAVFGGFPWSGSNQDLIQAGCDPSVLRLSNTFHCFYELCDPGGSGTCADPVVFSNSVTALDVVTALITCTANCTAAPTTQTWTLAISDCGPPGSFVPPCAIGAGSNLWNESYTGITFESTLGQAIWISENPGAGTAPVPNYGSVTFISLKVNGAAVNLNGSGVTPLQMDGALNVGNNTQNPSSPTADGVAFKLCWGVGGAYTTCPAPVSSSVIVPGSGEHR